MIEALYLTFSCIHFQAEQIIQKLQVDPDLSVEDKKEIMSSVHDLDILSSSQLLLQDSQVGVSKYTFN